MNYTQNYHLPQWADTDRIQMNHFNEAMAEIEKGITAAQGKADELPFAVGTYEGRRYVQQTFDVGFRPSAVLISGDAPLSDDTASKQIFGICTALVIGNSLSQMVTLTDTGFSVAPETSQIPYLNRSSLLYRYIAFR